MIRLRLDVRLRGRIDASDVLQEAFVDASRRLAEYAASPSMPLFLWLRFLTSQRLQLLHRQHFGPTRDAVREVSLHAGALPWADSMSLAMQLLGRQTSPSQAAAPINTTPNTPRILGRVKRRVSFCNRIFPCPLVFSAAPPRQGHGAPHG